MHSKTIKSRCDLNESHSQRGMYFKYKKTYPFFMFIFIFITGCSFSPIQKTFSKHEGGYDSGINIVVMSDPQAWRLETGDPNDTTNMEPWENRNRNVVNSLNLLSKNFPVSYSILNGDITEYGRENTWDSYYKIYSKLSFPVFFGLGNHDYENNYNDCSDFPDLDSNACARNSIHHMDDEEEIYRYRLSNYDRDYNSNDYKGSLAYSWDEEGLHFVQLQNHPVYTKTFSHWINKTISITGSLNWLERDLEKANARGKVSILNFHRGDSSFINGMSSYERDRFRNMINNYRVIAIFNGHTHQAKEEPMNPSVFGHAKIYNSGALFKGDYLLVNIRGNCIKPTYYNGRDGTPKKISEFSSSCWDVSDQSKGISGIEYKDNKILYTIKNGYGKVTGQSYHLEENGEYISEYSNGRPYYSFANNEPNGSTVVTTNVSNSGSSIFAVNHYFSQPGGIKNYNTTSCCLNKQFISSLQYNKTSDELTFRILKNNITNKRYVIFVDDEYVGEYFNGTAYYSVGKISEDSVSVLFKLNRPMVSANKVIIFISSGSPGDSIEKQKNVAILKI